MGGLAANELDKLGTYIYVRFENINLCLVKMGVLFSKTERVPVRDQILGG